MKPPGCGQGKAKKVGGVGSTSGFREKRERREFGFNRRLIDAACNRWEIARGGDPNGDWRRRINADMQNAKARKVAESDKMAP